MAENRSSSSSMKAPTRPSITLPQRSSIDGLFIAGGGASPGPMTLVSSFFSDHDQESECGSFSQLLAGAMEPPAALPGIRPNFPPQQPATAVNSTEKEEASGGDADFSFRLNRPAGLAITQPLIFTIPPGFSPAGLLDSPGQGTLGISHQQAIAQITAQARIQYDHPSSSVPPAPQFFQLQMPPPPVGDPNSIQESSDVSHSDHVPEPASFPVDKPADDGYNWRKYGQKPIKGSEFPRSYYKCTHPNCPVKKKVERSLDGQITEIIYKGKHNHQLPQPRKGAKDTGNQNGTFGLQGSSEPNLMGTTTNVKDGVMKDHEPTQEHTSGSRESEEAGNAKTRVNGRDDDDERESKRRITEGQISEPVASHRTVTEPKIVVQTTSEVDLLDDGYRWRKYGQKVVKGNPFPRSYYKCTTQGCNVRKHIERLATDPKAVITAYEGKHNHDLPAARNSSHNTANNAALNLRQHNPAIDNQAALLQFKEEQIT